MLYDPQNFLHSMCVFAAIRAGTSLSPGCTVGYSAGPTLGNISSGVATPPFNLWLNEANETDANIGDPFATLRLYGGSHERNSPKVEASVQLAVVGKSNVAAWFLANSLFRAFCLTNQEKELRMIPVPGFKLADNTSNGTWTLVNAVVTNLPGQVGRDDRGRVKIVSNFDLGFFKAA